MLALLSHHWVIQFLRSHHIDTNIQMHATGAIFIAEKTFFFQLMETQNSSIICNKKKILISQFGDGHVTEIDAVK